jgi:hypothetical protein
MNEFKSGTGVKEPFSAVAWVSNETAVGGHHHVHVYLCGLRVLFVAEVEQRCCRRRCLHSVAATSCLMGDDLERAGLDQCIEGQCQCDSRTGNGCGARAAVGLDYIAIENDGAFAESISYRLQSVSCGR